MFFAPVFFTFYVHKSYIALKFEKPYVPDFFPMGFIYIPVFTKVLAY